VSFWLPESIKSVLAGRWLARGAAPVPVIDGSTPEPAGGVSIDTRALAPGQVFFALRGEKVDGHAFLDAAAQAGASLAVVDTPDAIPQGAARFNGRLSVLAVADAPAALIRLASAWRQSLTSTRVVAIAGSNGKTTTTRLTHAVLSAALKGASSQKSFNNSIGVPLTMLNAPRSAQFLICEIGTNAPGELAPLARLVSPDTLVITSLGREHLEGFGTLEGVAREETSAILGVRAGGAVIAQADSALLLEHARAMIKAAGNGVQLITFGASDGADLRITDVRTEPPGPGRASARTGFTINGRGRYEVPLPGAHNASNAAAAIAVARRLGLSDEVIAPALAGARGAEMRLECAVIGGVAVLNDAYNANPDSMLAALATFAALYPEVPRRVAVLGDMLELGAQSERSHREVGEAVGAMLRSGALSRAVFVGPMSAHAADSARAVTGGAAGGAVEQLEALDAASLASLRASLEAGDALLLKGSRRMGLERLARALAENVPTGLPIA
jgi:UDP-N-acetylmuramoyl-tripeptide--D-alanyl-D-alanine ligase